jgi:UDP-glucuronate 4-epimerase
MSILITGSAGFIGSALTLKLLKNGYKIIGVDNLNDYYDINIKKARLKLFIKYKNYLHFKLDITNPKTLQKVFKNHHPKIVVNLAAQAGVRYSMKNPSAYINSNIVGFGNILENCRYFKVEHLIYASTSSVYGANTRLPLSEHNSANHPLSIYSATKRSNELMAHAYSNLFKIPTTGLRFFTVYGPWGRPDMALFKFTKAILENKSINVFNYGKHTRDFTYIDDIVDGIIEVLNCPASRNLDWNSNRPDPATSNAPWQIYNIGNSRPVQLLDYIKQLEKALGKKSKIKYLTFQPGEVLDTFANMNDFKKKFDYKPKISVSEGIKKFVNWYKEYYKYQKL